MTAPRIRQDAQQTWIACNREFAGGGAIHNGEYAGKLGTLYRDWHTSPMKAPRAVRGDDS